MPTAPYGCHCTFLCAASTYGGFNMMGTDPNGADVAPSAWPGKQCRFGMQRAGVAKQHRKQKSRPVPPRHSVCARQRHALWRGLRAIDAYAFSGLFTGLSMLDQVEPHLPAHREPLRPTAETLALFLGQALSADRSCQHRP